MIDLQKFSLQPRVETLRQFYTYMHFAHANKYIFRSTTRFHTALPDMYVYTHARTHDRAWTSYLSPFNYSTSELQRKDTFYTENTISMVCALHVPLFPPVRNSSKKQTLSFKVPISVPTGLWRGQVTFGHYSGIKLTLYTLQRPYEPRECP